MSESSSSFYDQNGFIIFDEPVLSSSLVEAATKGMDDIRAGIHETGIPPEPSPWNPGDDPSVLCKMEQPQKCSLAIREAISSPLIGEKVAEVTGAEMVQVWWVQLLYKPSTEGDENVRTHVGWHQDWNYWSGTWEDGSELMTAWLALSDVGENSGPMSFVPRSHTWPDVGGGDFFSQDPDSLSFNVPEGEIWEEVAGCMPGGGFSIHDKLTLHGSSPNVSALPRRSFAIHLRTDKSRPKHGHTGLAKFLNDPDINPIIYGEKIPTAF